MTSFRVSHGNNLPTLHGSLVCHPYLIAIGYCHFQRNQE